MKFTKKIIREKIKQIEQISNDDEAAHSHEDALYSGFIESLSKHDYKKKEIKEMAKLIMKTKKISFARWGA